MQDYKIPAVKAFARNNAIDKTLINPSAARIGIMAAGKAWLDTRQALDDLGLDDERASELGIRIRKIGMPWPLEPEGLKEFASGLDEIIVVDEKRAVMEPQVKELLYHLPAARRPRVTGKTTPHGAPAIHAWQELNADLVARVIANRLIAHNVEMDLRPALARMDEHSERVSRLSTDTKRLPYFCSGCPHNSSTRVPEGSQAAAGIGCHYMVTWMDRRTETFTQMGAEGANWLGRAPFTKTPHMFVNIGDGTLFHSGTLAIRAGVASGANVTYKILYNDAVAMTGGQPMDGPMTVPMVTQQMYAEGIRRIAVVSDEPHKYAVGTGFATGTTVHHRDDLDQVQRDIRLWPGVSVLIFDQTCAAEKRRRRKRGTYPDPDKRAFINTLVCEGCGDCGTASNCVSLTPVETISGRKRAIDQSSCNKDFSCTDGFCPSFVTVEGADLRKPAPIKLSIAEVLSTPTLPTLDQPYDVMIVGIGGTGVVTVGHILAMAAHMEEKAVSVLDIAGLAQKNGAVYTHLRFGKDVADLRATRIGPGRAHLLLGFDMITAATPETLSCLSPDHTAAIINSHETMTADFTTDPDLQFPRDQLSTAIQSCSRSDLYSAIDVQDLTARLMGDKIAANMMLTGFAWQRGHLPLSLQAIEAAVELNDVAVDFNKRAFDWGRRLAHSPEMVDKILSPEEPVDGSLKGLLKTLVNELSSYQDASYARRFLNAVTRVQVAEQRASPGSEVLSRTVAINLHKLMAYKDEYEVARLFTDGRFEAELNSQFSGDYKVTYHMAPPLIARRDVRTGIPRKMAFGGWLKPVLKVIAGMRRLRATPFDIFGYSEERKKERARIDTYMETLERIMGGLNANNLETALQIADLPKRVRGFGHIKDANAAKTEQCLGDLLETFEQGEKQAAE